MIVSRRSRGIQEFILIGQDGSISALGNGRRSSRRPFGVSTGWLRFSLRADVFHQASLLAIGRKFDCHGILRVSFLPEAMSVIA
jgi:hypothetical protein